MGNRIILHEPLRYENEEILINIVTVSPDSVPEGSTIVTVNEEPDEAFQSAKKDAEDEVASYLAWMNLGRTLEEPTKRVMELKPGYDGPVTLGKFASFAYGNPLNVKGYSQPPFFTLHNAFTAGTHDSLTWPHEKLRTPTFPKTLTKHMRESMTLDQRDLDIIAFIAHTPSSTPLALSILTGQDVENIMARLNMLTIAGFLYKDTNLDLPLFRATRYGMDAIQETTVSPKNKTSSVQWLKHNMICSLLAAELTRGRIQLDGEHYYRPLPLNAPPHGTNWGTPPLPHEGIIKEGRRMGENVVTDTQIRASFGAKKAQQNLTGKGGGKKLLDQVRATVNGYDGNGIPPEILNGNEYMLYVSGTSTLEGNEHPPDLVCKRPRVGTEPQSVAIEVELTAKSKGKTGSKEDSSKYYEDICRNTLSGPYGSLYYFCYSPRVADIIRIAMEKVEQEDNLHGTKGDRLHIVRLDNTLGNVELLKH